MDISKNGDGSIIAKVEDDKTISIEGNGEMVDCTGFYEVIPNPYEYGSKLKNIIDTKSVENVEISEGITTLGRSLFDHFGSLKNAVIPASIENESFQDILLFGFYNYDSIFYVQSAEHEEIVNGFGEVKYE